MARKLGVAPCGSFGEHHGTAIGVWGALVCTREALQEKLTGVLGMVPRVMPFGPGEVRRVGIVTGAAGSMIGQAAAAGLDTSSRARVRTTRSSTPRSWGSTCSTPAT